MDVPTLQKVLAPLSRFTYGLLQMTTALALEFFLVAYN